MKKIILLILLLIIIIPFFIDRSNISSKITLDNIKKISIGMTKNEVILMLGEPFSIKLKEEKYYGKNSYVMSFSKPVYWAKSYPMIWVHLKDDIVDEVYVKKYFGIFSRIDDIGIYLLTKNKKWSSPIFDKLIIKSSKLSV